MHKSKFDVIFDMDDVLVDWYGGYRAIFKDRFPLLQFKEPEEREHWWLPDNYPVELRSAIYQIGLEKDFFLNLRPKPGGIEAVEWAFKEGHGVTICTSPLWEQDPSLVGRCIQEKVSSISKHLGHLTPLFTPDSAIQVIFTHDKTQIHGDVLIDDRPLITGKLHPTWTHLLFDEGHKYAEKCPQQKINWVNYKEVLTQQHHLWLQKKTAT